MTDADGIKASATVEVRVTGAPNQCPTEPPSRTSSTARALDLNRWTVLRSPTTSSRHRLGRQLHLPIDNGSIYQAGTSARNIITQPTPERRCGR